MHFGWIGFICSAICSVGVLCSGNLIVSLKSFTHDNDSPLKMVAYCIDCPSPTDEGSIVNGLIPKYGLRHYQVAGELIYCVPNLADSNFLINSHQLEQRIAFVDRGSNSLLEKAIKLQNVGVIGIIIADDGQCDEHFRFCGVRAGSVTEGGFAAHDNQNEGWKDIKIPVILVSIKTAEKIRNLMPVERVNVGGIGFQNISVIMRHDGTREEL